ncbi:MAG: peptidyl-alpha-hydroxyglycine alpha-amidating lyase family protein [Gemmatimonadales bacterium]
MTTSVDRRRRWVAIAAAACIVAPALLSAQAGQAPTNDLPNPYRTVEGWARLPEGRSWGSTSAVDIDRNGHDVWVAERCGANSCAGSDLAPVLHFDPSGNLLAAFGAGLFVSPHGIFVDRDDHIWVTDCACTGGRRRGGRGAGGATASGPATATEPRGHQVYEFSRDGKVLRVLGTAGGAREPGYFFQPNDVLVAPDGSIFVSEGHSSAPTANARVLKFSRDGALVASWGTHGSGPGEFDQPHALAMDSRGRLFVGDRGNNRIQIFDQNGKLLDIWYQFSRPSGIWIDKHDTIYVADSESGSVAPAHGGWKRGIRIGSAISGEVTALIPDPDEHATGTSAAEGVAVDADGNIYGAEVGPRALKRYVKHQ